MEDERLDTRYWMSGGRAFYVELEQAFWSALEEIADSYDVTVTALVFAVRRKNPCDLESALRVFVIEHYHALQSSFSVNLPAARLQ